MSSFQIVKQFSNCQIVAMNGKQVFFSYQTPIACYTNGQILKSKDYANQGNARVSANGTTPTTEKQFNTKAMKEWHGEVKQVSHSELLAAIS